MGKATCKVTYGEDLTTQTVIIDLSPGIELHYYPSLKQVKVEDFWNKRPKDLKKFKETAKAGGRTLAGQSMEWVCELAKALQATEIILQDDWDGLRADGTKITSKDMQAEANEELRDWRARYHAYGETSADDIKAGLKRSGYYGMWEFVSPYPDMPGINLRTVAVDKMPVLRSSFVDACSEA